MPPHGKPLKPSQRPPDAITNHRAGQPAHHLKGENAMYESKETRFFVGSEEYSDKELFISIPERYKTMFDGAKFKDMHHLSQALAFAKSANEARFHGAAHLLRNYENALKKCF
jgi:hypothetical protein